MKKIIFMLALVTGGIASAQKVADATVPAKVKGTFASLYPNSKVAEWKKEDGNYDARFEKEGKKMCVAIDPSGSWVETKEKMEVSDLPAGAKTYVESSKGDHKISEAWKITYANDAKVNYKAVVKDDCLLFDSAGNYLKTEKKKK
jgi:hypothetical protein